MAEDSFTGSSSIVPPPSAPPEFRTRVSVRTSRLLLVAGSACRATERRVVAQVRSGSCSEAGLKLKKKSLAVVKPPRLFADALGMCRRVETTGCPRLLLSAVTV